MSDPAYRRLSFNLRSRIRQICLEEWSVVDHDEDGAERAIEAAKLRVQGEFGGILTLLLIAIASKLIVELILRWLDSEQPAPLDYQSEEPGYE